MTILIQQAIWLVVIILSRERLAIVHYISNSSTCVYYRPKRCIIFLIIYVSVCVTSPDQTKKRCIAEIWYTHFPRPYLKLLFYLFSKKWPFFGSQNCGITWIFRISPRLPCQNSREENVYSYICIIVYLSHAPWPNEKRLIAEIWYTHFPRPYLKTILI